MQYQIQIIRSNRKSLALQIKPDGSIIVRAPYSLPQEKIDEFINKHKPWIEKQLQKINDDKQKAANIPKLKQEEIQKLADEALKYIPGRVEYYSKIVGVSYGKITIRNQKTRWGSCSSKGNLNFNCLLMLMPKEVIDSVVVHELCHRKQMNHSPAFYDLVEKTYPEYHKWNKWLKENGSAIMSRMVNQ